MGVNFCIYHFFSVLASIRSPMRLLSFLGSLSFIAFSVQQSIDSYIQSETPIAKAGVLANIGPDGSKSSGASPGVVIASPSTTNPTTCLLGPGTRH